MRGTPYVTNKALSEPVLMLGAERGLVLLALPFWTWALFGVFPHWPSFLVLIAAIVTIFLLRLAAKKDAQGRLVFSKNSRFLLQNRYYHARGFSTIEPCRKVVSVPLRLVRF